jgi:hypothetical protein
MSTGQSCEAAMRASLATLAPRCPAAKLTELVALVDSTMLESTRYYHHLTHALMVGGSNDPLDMLVGLFHDLIQVNVDQGLAPAARAQLEGMIHSPAPLSYALIDSPSTRSDRTFEMVRMMFGLAPGQTLSPFGGQNEFLSALAAAKALASVLDEADIVAVTLAIEATLHFRKDLDDVPRASLHKLEMLNEHFSLGLSQNALRAQVHRSVRLANRDVCSFGSDDLIALLDDTWDLMLESSPDLRRTEGAGLTRYRQTLHRMTHFLGSLTAPVIYRQFDSEPDAANFEALTLRTARNIAAIRSIMHCKLLATSLLEAAAASAEAQFLPKRHALAGVAGIGARVEPAMLPVLAVGSDAVVEFDIRQSPLSYAIAASMTASTIERCLQGLDPVAPVPGGLLAMVPEKISAQARVLAGSMIRG